MATQTQLFVDWTVRNDGKTEAIGTLGGHKVTLTGRGTGVSTDPPPLGTAILNGTFTGFGTDRFTPPLPASDLIEIVGLKGQSTFKVEFDTEVKDFVLHLGSLASTLVFQDLPMGTQVTKLSGDEDFRVQGNTVTGEAYQPPQGSTEPTDSDGSVRIRPPRPLRQIEFTLKPRFDGGSVHDGVHLQIGGIVEPLLFVDWTFRNDGKTEATGKLNGSDVTLTGRGTGVSTDPPPLGTAILNGTFTGFGTDRFTPPLPASDLTEIVGLKGESTFIVNFSDKMTDLVLHLGSLASTLVFQDLPTGTEVTKLSGDEDFRVQGNTVTGEAYQPPQGSTEPTDSDGSVRIRPPTPLRQIEFTLKPRFDGGSVHDGVHLQIGGTPTN
ncbi:hypothetical protein PV726_37845 [Streptomyces europaeiscabiei]|uniref:hypothetical protein n=1 Tax=Streptomyces europaeiscabiei TaxID=146819 RepID=UPI0029B82270|nr:hypothetical protein [Streptomyces europaeiscabiei]MDX3695983.1 hypothetical protein [Streptomyces europaeiscabiei]